MTKTMIIVEVNSCQECPLCSYTWGQRTGMGLAFFDMFCSAERKYIFSAQTINITPDIPPVPTWCPKKVVE